MNGLIGYVKQMEEERKQKTLKQLENDGEGAQVEEPIESYRYPPAQLSDGKCLSSCLVFHLIYGHSSLCDDVHGSFEHPQVADYGFEIKTMPRWPSKSGN